MCAQCPTESWERSCRPCDVNSQHHSVSWLASNKTKRRKHYSGFYSQPCDGQMELTVKLWDNICVISFFIHILMMINKLHYTDCCEVTPVLTQTGNQEWTVTFTLLHLLLSVLSSTLLLSLSPSLSLFLFHLSLISLSISQSSSCSLIFTQPCYTRVQESQIERGRGRAVEGNGSQTL